MIETVAGLMHSEWRKRYEDLWLPFVDLHTAYIEWELGILDRQSAVTRDELRYNQFNRLMQLGPDTLELKTLVDSIESLKSKDIVWGYARPRSGLLTLNAPTIWVALADSETVECAKVMTYDERSSTSIKHLWLGVESSFGCRGRGELLSLSLTERIRRRIDSVGGILLR